MDRKEFLTALGYASGALIFATCLAGCKKEDNSNSTTPAPVVDFTLELTQPANAALNTNGGFIYSNGIIVAKTTAGNIIAVSQACTHQGTTVQFQGVNNQFFCPNHGSTFSTSGAVTGAPATASLKQYNVTITGNLVRVNG
jgi:cytochrome b6-f complex iron-sulfur subunit